MSTLINDDNSFTQCFSFSISNLSLYIFFLSNKIHYYYYAKEFIISS